MEKKKIAQCDLDISANTDEYLDCENSVTDEENFHLGDFDVKGENQETENSETFLNSVILNDDNIKENIETKPAISEENIPDEVKSKNFLENKKMIGIAIGVLIIAILVAIIIYGQVQKKTYAADLNNISYTIMKSSASCEDVGNQIRKVWYNAIFDEYDLETYKYTAGASNFNEAVQNLFEDTNFSTKVSVIKNDKMAVDEYIRSLKSPPSEYEKCYDAVLNFYNEYCLFVEITTSPSGSLTTFSQNFNDADKEMSSAYRIVKSLLPDVK